MLIVATKCALRATFIQSMPSLFRNLALVQQFAILDNEYLYIDLRRSLINTSIMLLTNND